MATTLESSLESINNELNRLYRALNDKPLLEQDRNIVGNIDEHGEIGVRAAIKKGGNVNIRFKFLINDKYIEFNPSGFAIYRNCPKALEYLLDTGKVFPLSTLHDSPILVEAARRGNVDMVTNIITALGINVNCKSEHTNETALLASLLHVSTYALINHGKWKDPATKEFLLKWYKDSRNKRKVPDNLNLEVEWDGHVDIFETLLKRGADLEIPCKLGGQRFTAADFLKNPSQFFHLLSDDSFTASSIKKPKTESEPFQGVKLANPFGRILENVIVHFNFKELRNCKDEHAKPTPGVSAPSHVEVWSVNRKLDQVTSQAALSNRNMLDHLAAREAEIKQEAEMRAAEQALLLRNQEQMQKHHEDLERKLRHENRRVDDLKRGLQDVSRDLKEQEMEQKEMAEKISSNAELSETLQKELLDPKRNHEMRLAFMNQPGNVLVKHFYRSVAAELKGCIIKAHVGTGGFKRDGGTKLDYFSSFLEVLKDHVSIPIVSGLIGLASKGVGAYSDHREKSKSKNAAHHAPLEDGTFCEEFGLSLAEKLHGSLIGLADHNKAKKFAAHATLLALASLTKLDDKLDLDPPELMKHMLKEVMGDQTFSSKILQLSPKNKTVTFSMPPAKSNGATGVTAAAPKRLAGARI